MTTTETYICGCDPSEVIVRDDTPWVWDGPRGWHDPTVPHVASEAQLDAVHYYLSGDGLGVDV